MAEHADSISFLIALLGGYLIGSIPFGLLLTKAAGLGDIRKVGSGNIGATNVLRTGRKGLAAATLILDGLKGAVAILLARYFLGDQDVVVGTAAVVFWHLRRARPQARAARGRQPADGATRRRRAACRWNRTATPLSPLF